jgi:hypothetical protein
MWRPGTAIDKVAVILAADVKKRQRVILPDFSTSMAGVAGLFALIRTVRADTIKMR